MTNTVVTADDPSGAEGGNILKFTDNMEFSKGNYIIFEGCHQLDGNFQTPKVSIKNIMSPKADKTTNDFKVEMFKDQSEIDSYSLSNPIVSGTGRIDAAIF